MLLGKYIFSKLKFFFWQGNWRTSLQKMHLFLENRIANVASHKRKV